MESPNLDSNIPVKLAYGAYVSQLIRYTRTWSDYKDFLYIHQLFVQKLVLQGYKQQQLKHSFCKFCHTYPIDISNKYKIDHNVMVKEGIVFTLSNKVTPDTRTN